MTSPDKLRVLFVCGGSYVFGKEIMALSVMRGFQSRGHAVRCVTNAWNDGDFHSRLERAGIPYHPIPLGKVSKSLTPRYIKWTLDALVHLPKAWFDYWRYTRTVRSDVTVFYGFSNASLLRPFIEADHTVYHVQDFDERSLHSRHLLSTSGQGGAAFVAISESIAERLHDSGVESEKIHVVHNGVEAPARKQNGANVDRGAAETSSSGPLQIGIVGQVGAWKGHEDWIEALALLRARGCSFEGHIFGSGDDDYVAALKRKMVRKELDQHVVWHGFVTDTASIYEQLDVNVVPSRHEEPFGLVAVEAGLHGLPVVVARRGGLPEIVVDGETGFIVDAEAPAQIAERLATLLEDPALRKRMGRAARKRALKHFTTERMVDEVERLLQRVTTSSS